MAHHQVANDQEWAALIMGGTLRFQDSVEFVNEKPSRVIVMGAFDGRTNEMRQITVGDMNGLKTFRRIQNDPANFVTTCPQCNGTGRLPWKP